jgi:hypothetical protein
MSMIYNNDIIGKKQSVVDEILLLNPHQTPMLSLLGFAEAITQTEHQWYEDEMWAADSVAVGAKTAADTTIVVADTEAFRPNQVVKVGEELIYVTAVDTVTKTLTIQRSFAGTTAAAIADGAKVEVMFEDGKEGADARESRYKPRKRVSNITQIFHDAVRISGTAEAVTQYGITDLYAYEKDKVQLMEVLKLEKALVNGIRYEKSDTERYMRGVRDYIQTNVTDAASAQIADAMLIEAAQSVYEAGGFKTGGDYKFLVPAKQKVKVSNFNSDKIRIERGDNSRGQVVDWIVCDFGRFEISLNENLHSNEVIFMDANRAKIRPVQGREFHHMYLGVKGDYKEGMIVGEYTLEFKQEKAHARIKNLA